MGTTATTLLAPRGALTVELLLPLRTLVADATTAMDVATAYASEGNRRTLEWTDDERGALGATAWATYRALTDRAQQILTAAASLSADDVARSYSVGQAQELKKDAATWLAAYEAQAALEAAGAVPAAAPLASRAVPITFAW